MGTVIQINSKSKEQYDSGNKTGLPKIAIDSAMVSESGVADDYNHYRKTRWKNTPNRAILIFPNEMMQILDKEGWPISPGDLGENITTIGIPYDQFSVGKQFQIGEIIIEITEKCKPCNNLAKLDYIGKEKIKDFMKIMKNRRGWYASVLKTGTIYKNDTIEELI